MKVKNLDKMATRLDRIIDRLRKITKETWLLHQKILNNFREYIFLYSTNIHWPTKTRTDILDLYNRLFNLHQNLIKDIEKLIPNIKYLTSREDEQEVIRGDILSKLRKMQEVKKELIDMQNYLSITQ